MTTLAWCTRPTTDTAARRYVARALEALRRLWYLWRDARAIAQKDPALRGSVLRLLEIPLYASIQALALHRPAHALHVLGVPFVPRLLSQLARFLTGIEIHPGATLGAGLFIDHGMGVVIGETAVVGEDALLFHGVTLGGVDDRRGRRHPLLGDGVIVGAGAKILGALHIGDGARIGAQSVVLRDVPAGATVVGIPARVVGERQQACC